MRTFGSTLIRYLWRGARGSFWGSLLGCLLFGTALAGELRLLMLDEDGCEFCERWDEEVGVIYGKTVEGRAAPLTRQRLHAVSPDRFRLSDPVRYTPTFVLLEEGTEVGRITGYPGEGHFWGLLEEMLRVQGAL